MNKERHIEGPTKLAGKKMALPTFTVTLLLFRELVACLQTLSQSDRDSCMVGWSCIEFTHSRGCKQQIGVIRFTHMGLSGRVEGFIAKGLRSDWFYVGIDT